MVYDKPRVIARRMDFLGHACGIKVDRVRNEVAQNLCGVGKKPG